MRLDARLNKRGLVLLSFELVRVVFIGLSHLSKLKRQRVALHMAQLGPTILRGLLTAGILDGAAHPLRQGLTDEIPFFKRQTRLVFARCGVTDPLSLQEYRALGGFEGLNVVLSLPPQNIVQQVTDWDLRRDAVERDFQLVSSGEAF